MRSEGRPAVVDGESRQPAPPADRREASTRGMSDGERRWALLTGALGFALLEAPLDGRDG